MPPTIAANAASAIRSERRSRKSVPLTQQQREQLARKREERNIDVDEKLTEWFQNTLDLADRLAEKYDMKPRYFLDKMFHGGARMIHAHQRVNPWNAFVDDEDNEDEDGPEVLKDISGSLAEEYAKLSEEEKQRYVNEFEQKRKQHNWGSFRVSSRSRLQDTRNCIKVLQEIMTALRVRNGCEGFFVVVRGSTTFHMDPQWHFTSKEFADYLPFAMNAGRFETASVGGRLEAFAIAGCSVINTLKTSKQKADFLKKRIRDRISELLGKCWLAVMEERRAMTYQAHSRDHQRRTSSNAILEVRDTYRPQVRRRAQGTVARCQRK
ncbi:hypothetical protein BDZ89DRAFT_964822 [Hymenopellis radicata]|nr:hypothetical protein BDZ89DRAFT_964822 [Hymenopellis radicata]